MENLTVDYYNGSFALAAPSKVYNVVLAQNVPQLITKPIGARKVFFAKTADFYANYVDVTNNELADLATNGTFAADTDWTKGTGWTISAGKANKSAGSASDLAQTPSKIVENQAYYLTFTVSSRTAGSITPKVGGTSGTARSTNATFSEYVVAGSDGTIKFSADATFDGKIDDVSIVPAAVVPSTTNTTGEASELNPVVRELSKISAISLVTPDASGAKITMIFSK